MIYEVIVDISNSEVDKVFDYSSNFFIAIGSRVKVPFGARTLEGFVIGQKESTTVKTKDIIAKLDDFTPITKEMVDLVKYLNKHNNLRYADSLRLCIPSKLRGSRVREKKVNFVILDVDYDLALLEVRKNAPKQLAVLNALKKGGEYESVLNSKFGVSAVKTLIEKGLLHREEQTKRRVPKSLPENEKQVVLNAKQIKAKNSILSYEGTTLLHGVTGSGKTEIYMAVIAEMLAKGKTAIMLVPEISLTPQMLAVFRARFKDEVAVMHSGLSDGERFDEWLRLLNGEAKVALGARSAIFAPLENVGVIIIDEEHDNSYVSESNPRYFTHEIAEFRRKYNNAKIILGSATPSLDSYLRAKNKEYNLITLEDRVNNQKLPDMEVVDMRKELRQGNTSMFSRMLLSELDITLKSGNQAMIYINRRGYSSFLRCKNCGYVPRCTDCEVSLTYHKDDNRLKCHYCGKQFYTLTECPVCGNKHLKLGRIGTETVVEELNKLFPNVKVLRLDNDTTSTKDSTREILSAFSKKEAQILVGTQMIVKGHDFKDVTLVGVLDADLSLYYSDYKSIELTFQQITQVAGRAGRESKEGRVIIQTYNPSHYVFRFAKTYDYIGFFEKESNIRETTKFPPYSKIARILIKSGNEERAMAAARICYNGIRDIKEKDIGLFRVQAMRAPIKRISNEFRFQVVAWIYNDKEDILLPSVYEIADSINKKDVVSFVEINPTNMR